MAKKSFDPGDMVTVDPERRWSASTGTRKKVDLYENNTSQSAREVLRKNEFAIFVQPNEDFPDVESTILFKGKLFYCCTEQLKKI